MTFVDTETYGERTVFKTTDYMERDTDSIAVEIGVMALDSGTVIPTIEGVVTADLLTHIRD